MEKVSLPEGLPSEPTLPELLAVNYLTRQGPGEINSQENQQKFWPRTLVGAGPSRTQAASGRGAGAIGAGPSNPKVSAT
ncbi:MAG: hypothetical protein D8M53_05050 [Armatimonadetes bacterium]|nr:hypothetical protein [Armatimonadota bacterium]